MRSTLMIIMALFLFSGCAEEDMREVCTEEQLPTDVVSQLEIEFGTCDTSSKNYILNTSKCIEAMLQFMEPQDAMVEDYRVLFWWGPYGNPTEFTSDGVNCFIDGEYYD